jgi:hypothetical protein
VLLIQQLNKSTNKENSTMKNKILLFLSILGLFWTMPVLGQQAEECSIVVGSRVRVSTGGYIIGKKQFKAGRKGYRLIGTVERLQPDTLVLKTDISPEPVVIPIALVERFDVSRGRKKSRTLEGAGIGFAIGAGLGAFLIKGTSENDLSDSDAALIGAGLMAIPGTLIGAMIGANKDNEKWETVDLAQIRSGISKNQ